MSDPIEPLNAANEDEELAQLKKEMELLKARMDEQTSKGPRTSKPCRDEAVKLEAVHIAARFSRRHECNALVQELKARGHTITSRWVKPDADGVEPVGPSELAPCADRRRFAMEDVADVQAADWCISLMEEPREGGRGGRHVEFGLALGLGKRLTIIGPRETVFHHLDEVEQFETVEEFLAAPTRTLPPSPVQDDDVERVARAFDPTLWVKIDFYRNGAIAERADLAERWARHAMEKARAAVAAISTRPTTHTACFEQAGEAELRAALDDAAGMSGLVAGDFTSPPQPPIAGEEKAILEAAPTGAVGGEEVGRG